MFDTTTETMERYARIERDGVGVGGGGALFKEEMREEILVESHTIDRGINDIVQISLKRDYERLNTDGPTCFG